MSAFATTAFEDDFASYEIRRDRRNPIQKLLRVMLRYMVKFQPLRAEIFRSFTLLIIRRQIGKPGDACANRVAL